METNKKSVLITELNNEKIILLVKDCEMQTIKKFIDDTVNAYKDETPPQTLKDYTMEHLQKLNIEILNKIDEVVKYAII